jgi:hypothetical protein
MTRRQLNLNLLIAPTVELESTSQYELTLSGTESYFALEFAHPINGAPTK